MKRHMTRGFGLIEMLVALAVLSILTALLGQSLISLTQARQENNAAAGIQDVMIAESQYKALYGNYATGATASKLSACPASGPPTVNQACLTSASFTDGKYYNRYLFTISQPADSGYLVIATPAAAVEGRLTYCGNPNDGLVRGIVSKTPPSLTTAAECDALPAVAQGATTNSTTTYQTTKNGVSLAPGSVTNVVLSLPAGTYNVAAVFNFKFYVDPNTKDVTCTLSGNQPFEVTTIPYGEASDSTGNAYDFGNGSLAGVVGVTNNLTLSCLNNTRDPLNSWSAVLNATPVNNVVSQ